MAILAVLSRAMFFRPVAAARRRAPIPPDGDEPLRPLQDPGHIERIAAYACAGYFHMSCLPEAFQLIGEVLLD